MFYIWLLSYVTLSHMYSADAPGTVRARSEYTYHDVVDDDAPVGDFSQTDMPILAGIEAVIAVPRHRRQAVAPAQSGRAETSREFAARQSSNFILRGPHERKEGGSGHPDTETNDVNAPKLTIRIPARKQAEADAVADTPPQPLVPDIPSILDLVSHTSDQGINILEDLCRRYREDAFFEVILKNPKEFRNYSVENDLIYLKENDQKCLCIPHILIKGRSAREIIIDEAHSMLAHLGASKTVDYLRSQVWWKSMIPDTKVFCETCNTCKHSKPSNQKPYGLLNPLKVPTQPWESIGIDFVGPLPPSKNRNGTFDMITVVICY